MTGIILAGGQSNRMGTDKANLPWEKGTLLTASIDKLVPFCKEIIVVGPTRPLKRKIRWTQDHYPDKGPLAGLHAGMEAAFFDSALVLPCDMPALPEEVLERLIKEVEGYDVVLPIHSNGREPLCAWYSKKACLPIIKSLLDSGSTGPLEILSKVRVKEIPAEEFFQDFSQKAFFANLNSPEDYELLRKDIQIEIN